MTRRSLGRLELAGLALRVGRGWVLPPLATPCADGDELATASIALLDALGNRPGRLLAVPRALLRHAAGELTRGGLAALVACAVRCCWLRKERGRDGWRPDFAGRVCGVRVAAAMGVCERTFRDGRLRLESAGLLGRCQRSPAWADARWGRRLVVAPACPAAGRGRRDGPACALLTGPAADSRAPSAAPDLTNTPAKRDVKHQDGAPHQVPGGRETADRTTATAAVGASRDGSSGGKAAGRPSTRRRADGITRDDLTDPDRLRQLYRRLLDGGEVQPGDAARVRFAGATARAAECGGNPGGLLRWLLREMNCGRRLDWITQAQEDAGLRRMAGRPDNPPRRGDDGRDTGLPDHTSPPARPATIAPPVAALPTVPSAAGRQGGWPERTDAETLAWAQGWALIRHTESAAVLRKRCGWDDVRIAATLAAATTTASVLVASPAGG